MFKCEIKSTGEKSAMFKISGEQKIYHCFIFDEVFAGELPEWLNGTVSKTVSRWKSGPGFESLTLRHRSPKLA